MSYHKLHQALQYKITDKVLYGQKGITVA